MGTEFLIASNVLLWAAFLALAALMVGVVRQIGLLHERSAPLGAMMTDHGPDIGEHSPVFNVETIDGEPLMVGRAITPGRPTLLMFTGPSCPVCAKLLPIIRSVAASEGAEVVLISDGTAAEHREFLRNHPLRGEHYVNSPEIGMRYQVSKVPYGVMLDKEGVIQGKGLCNTREHVESLFETTRLGHESLQSYIKKESASANATEVSVSEHVH